MLFNTLNGRNAAVAFMEVNNVDGAGSLTQNLPVCLFADGNTANGIAGGHPASTSIRNWVGVANTTIPINGYGLVQIWGFRNSVLVSNSGTSISITAADVLVPVAGTGLGVASLNAAMTAVIGRVQGLSLQTINVSASGYVKIQLRTI